MDIHGKLEKELIAAAKLKDKVRLSAIRMIKTSLHNREIDLKREMNEGEFLQLLASLVKQRKDSIEQFEKGNRQDLADKEKMELGVIQEFMPQQLSDNEVGAEIEKAIKEAGATTIKDMGKVMKILMPALTGRADGKSVGEIVKAKLSR